MVGCANCGESYWAAIRETTRFEMHFVAAGGPDPDAPVDRSLAPRVLWTSIDWAACDTPASAEQRAEILRMLDPE